MSGTYKQLLKDGRITREHRVIAEKALGKPIPKGVHVHHMNYDKTDNHTPWNLVVCTAAYHRLIHQRTDALAASGNANWRKCNICHLYDDPKNMCEKLHRSSFAYHHIECAREYRRTRSAAAGKTQRPEKWK